MDSLRQGNKYKNRNYKKVEKKWFDQFVPTLEGLENNDDSSNSDKTTDQLIAEYKGLLNDIFTVESNNYYRTRASSGNIYLNQNIRFKNTDGSFVYAYVTAKGIVKKYPSLDVFNKNSGVNGCPPPNYIDLNMPWKVLYDTIGASIQMPDIGANKGPILKVGSPMIQNQSCGYEGTNVMVSQMNDTPISRFIGCYDNSINASSVGTSFNFMNNSEPYQNYIVNFSFSASQSLSSPGATLANQNYTNTGATNLLSPWNTTNTTNSVVIVNSNFSPASSDTTSLIFPKPYPNSNSPICVAINSTGDISQRMTGLKAGTYTLNLNATCGKYSPNPLNILINNISLFTSSANYITSTSSWAFYQFNYTLQSDGDITLTFKGTDTASPSTKYTAIQNVRFTDGKANTANGVSFLQCQSKAKELNAAYFSFQNVNDAGSGYCGLMTDSNFSVSNLNPAIKNTPMKLKESGTTTEPTKGLSAILRKDGVLYVKLTDNTTYRPFSTNSPLSVQSDCYLIITDDGFLKIYKGAAPPATGSSSSSLLLYTTDKALYPLIANADYKASNGKNSQNWIASNTDIQRGEFIGSPSGNLYLMMGSDGNLTLNTTSKSGSCSVNATSKVMQGGTNSGALYKVNTPTDNLFTYLGKMFYITDDDKLQTYDNTKKGFANEYIEIKDYNNPGTTFNITGDTNSYNTNEKCASLCNSKTECYGYSFQSNPATCTLKNSTISGDTGGPDVPGTSLYIRKEKITSMPIGVDSIINNVFNTQKQNYITGGSTLDSYNVDTDLEAKKLKAKTLQDQIYKNLQNSINKKKTETDSIDFEKITNEIKETKNQIITTPNKSLDNMLSDTNVLVLQENRKYIMWSILAASSVLVAMAVSKN
jgi:hypothetical protein